MQTGWRIKHCINQYMRNCELLGACNSVVFQLALYRLQLNCLRNGHSGVQRQLRNCFTNRVQTSVQHTKKLNKTQGARTISSVFSYVRMVESMAVAHVSHVISSV